MSKPKVLIHGVGGVAYWSSEGDVDVVLVDEDNIRAGEPPAQLNLEWVGLASTSLDTSDKRIVTWT